MLQPPPQISFALQKWQFYFKSGNFWSGKSWFLLQMSIRGTKSGGGGKNQKWGGQLWDWGGMAHPVCMLKKALVNCNNLKYKPWNPWILSKVMNKLSIYMKKVYFDSKRSICDLKSFTLSWNSGMSTYTGPLRPQKMNCGRKGLIIWFIFL